jgi:hypothetical protein
MDSRWHLHLAETIDGYRIVPRLLIFSMLIWMIHVVDETLFWYMRLPVEAQSLQASGLAASIVATVTGLWTVVFKIYSASGRDWNAQPLATTSITATQTTSTAPAT